MYVLDTSALIDLLDNTERSKKIQKILVDEDAVINVISLHEFFAGASEKDIFVIKNIMQGTQTLAFTDNEAEVSGKIAQNLSRKGTMINAMDPLIAGICITNDATLVTFDNDFKKIPGLKMLEL